MNEASPPAGLFLATSARYWKAANSLAANHAEAEIWEPANYLLAMAIELALKSGLLVAGLSQKQLKHLGHNLSDLLRKCVQRGFRFSIEQVQMVLYADEAHRRHYFRYGPRSMATTDTIMLLPDFQHLLKQTAGLIDSVGGDPSLIRGSAWAQTDVWPPLTIVTDPASLVQIDALEKHIIERGMKFRNAVDVAQATLAQS